MQTTRQTDPQGWGQAIEQGDWGLMFFSSRLQ